MGKDFTTADTGRKFSKGGTTMASKMNPGFMAMMAKKKAGAKKMAGGGMPMKDGKPAFIGDGKGAMKKGGMAGGGSFRASANGVATKGKTKGAMVKMNKGGKAC